MPNCIYFDIDNRRDFTFGPIECSHPASINGHCLVYDNIDSCDLLFQRYFVYDLKNTPDTEGELTIYVYATFPPWKAYQLQMYKDIIKWEDGVPIKFNNKLTDVILRNTIANISKEKYQHIKLISMNN